MLIRSSSVDLSAYHAQTAVDYTRTTTQAWVGNRPTQPGATPTTATTPATSPKQAGPAALAQMSAGLVAARAAAAKAGSSRATGPGASVVQLPAHTGPSRTGPAHSLPTSSTAKSAASASSKSSASDDPNDPLNSDPTLRMLALLVEALTGRKVRLIKASDVQTDGDAKAQEAGERAAQAADETQAQQGQTQAPAQAGWGVEITVEQSHQESETTAYAATGQVVTADGQTIQFSLQVAMQREESWQATVDIQAGDAVRKVDPVALNLQGGPVQLSPQRISFDLDSDGTAEQVAAPAPGTYFLALDRNGNGQIDNGSELFGPASGNGFAELAALDSNGNGWIDEADPAYAALRLWNGSGETKGLAELAPGALYLGNVATPFEEKSAAGESLGQVVSSGLYLTDAGLPLALQQVDLVV